MSRSIIDDPVARALIEHLAARRGNGDPVGELTRALLDGEPGRELVRNSWLGEGLAEAVANGRSELCRMSPEQRADIERDAARLGRDRARVGEA
ncbi:hypothetical protein [Actinoplanes sp. G11-F43]|uniref:hypothetical protein n=1 Tax=Actinoplanes sp. G11-F43 TaxID=3424130 RepID=UPI003D32BE8D